MTVEVVTLPPAQVIVGRTPSVVIVPSGQKGGPGASAYQLAVAEGFDGTLDEWLQSIRGIDGEDGEDGDDGASAYELAVAGGFVGTVGAWLASLPGEDGHTPALTWRVSGGKVQVRSDAGAWEDVVAIADISGTDGDSAYAIAVANGFSGSAAAWLASLKGAKGDTPLVEWRTSSGQIQVRSDGGAWSDVVALSAITGSDGHTPVVEWRSASGYVQVRTDGGSWSNVVALADISGEDGSDGDPWQWGIYPRCRFNGTTWPSRASSIPAGYTGPVEFYSARFPAAGSPSDRVTGDEWTRVTA